MIRLWLKRLQANDAGAATVEYILILCLITIVCIAAENDLRETLSSLYDGIGETIATAMPAE